MSESTQTESTAGEPQVATLNPEAGMDAAAAFGVAGAASAESAEILNLLGDQEAGSSCCGGSCCAA